MSKLNKSADIVRYKNCTVQLERLDPEMFTVPKLDPEMPQTQKKEVSSGKYKTEDRERNKKKINGTEMR
jgi:hypothetical protein